MSFWLTASGVLLINVSLVVGEFAKTGWVAYPPLSELQYSPGVGVDYYLWSLQISGVGTLMTGINFVTTILKLRAPGMGYMRMPVFCWTSLAANLLIVAAFPVLTATLAMLLLDRYLGFHFFTVDGQGNPMMYVNLFWVWGHPEVYILILPPFGIFSEVVATFSGKPLFGYRSMVAATMAICVLSFLVWLHHFFTMGASADVNGFFGVMTMIIAVPTGVKVFNWLFTMYGGRVRFDVPILWSIGLGGIVCQVVQLVVSIRNRELLRVTGDPWNGRTLEWSTASPPPAWNFAVLPQVAERDTFWVGKQHAAAQQAQPVAQRQYESIEVPKNSPVGFVNAFFAVVAGFALIWHIWWMAGLALFGTFLAILIFAFRDEDEIEVPAAQIGQFDRAQQAEVAI